MLESAEEEKSSYFSFDEIPESQRGVASDSLLYNETNLITSLRWMSSTPAKEWIKQRTQEKERAQKSQDYFLKHRMQLEPLNARFSKVMDTQGGTRIYSMSSLILGLVLPPTVAIDYQHPEHVKTKWLAIEGAHVLLSFFQAFIPFMAVGPISSILYGATFKEQMHQAQYWESRLAAHLKVRELTGQNWGYELDLLRAQQINPFEVSRWEATQLVEKRKAALGIP
jgi:hypothetical protein